MSQRILKKLRVIFAILFTVALTVSFVDVKGLLPAKFYNSVLYLQFVPSFLKLITPGTILSLGGVFIVLLTLLGGRVYCSTICPLGVLQDVIIYLRKRINPKYRHKYRGAHNIVRYSLLALTILSFGFLGIWLINLLDPYANYGRIANNLIQPIILTMNNLVARIVPTSGLHVLAPKPVHLASLIFASSVLLLVTIMSWKKGRLYCNTVCPVGTFLGVLSKLSIFRIQFNTNSCTKCGKCQFVCKSDCINIKEQSIDLTRCVSCYNCISACNDNAIGYKFIPKKQKKQIIDTDPKRRFVLAASATFLLSKSLQLGATSHEHKGKGKGRGRAGRIRFHDRGSVAPPGAISIDHLKSRCVSCQLCVSVCPTKVLQPAFLEYGLLGMMVPKMDYQQNFCNFDCVKCGEACPTGAILHLSVEDKKQVQIGKVQLRLRHCIVESEGTACGSCSEHCPTQAVKMVPYKDGLTIPEIDPKICVGCGACEYACPVLEPHPAIFVASNAVHEIAEKPVSEKIEYEEKEEFPF